MRWGITIRAALRSVTATCVVLTLVLLAGLSLFGTGGAGGPPATHIRRAFCSEPPSGGGNGQPDQINLSVSAPTVNLGQSVTLTATVTDDACDGVPNETVTFNGIDQTSGDPTTCTTPADTS